MKVFAFKGVKNGYKVKKDILSAQDILLALFGRGGVSALLEPLFSKKSPHNPLQKNTSWFFIMKANFTNFLRSQSQKALAAIKILTPPKKRFFYGVF